MNEVTIWESQLAEIKNSFGKGLNDAQFTNFMQIGKALGLNPFMREIFAVNYNGDVSVFVARDGYRRNAISNPDYDGHIVDSIYEGDRFKVIAGVPEHVYSDKERNKIMGAYCICYKKSTRIPFFVKVNFGEYYRQTNIWKTKAETMIKKVAESQCLKASFPKLFNGTYDESERWEDKSVSGQEIIMPEKKTKPVPDPKPVPEPKKKFTPKPPIEKVETPKTEKPKLDNEKYLKNPEPKIDLSDVVAYDEKSIKPEFKEICDRIFAGWVKLRYNDYAITNSIKKHLGVVSLSRVTEKDDLAKYYYYLIKKYKEMVK